ncbi:unnamed protein product [Vicia faba]|uniref:Defensin-like protein n=1 Tax=Vicia faba TaxID=3906 RepID=A0AAV0YZI0_VICFA|nr:unnamed protein product [Vicia faba]
MANQMSNFFCFFALLVIVFAVQFIQIDGECSKLVGNCETSDCNKLCNFKARGVGVINASCSSLHLCTCTFDRPPPGGPTPPCDFVLGLCTNSCNYDCCDKKCKGSFPNTGSGTCIQVWGRDLCMCSYTR